MTQHLRAAFVMLLLFTALTGIAYPLAITGVAQVIAPSAANGSIVLREGRPAGSELIGQNFTRAKYFHGRPSATSGTDPVEPHGAIDSPYNAASSTGSNLGPLSKKMLDRVHEASELLKKESGWGSVPVDAVTTSASGLDPHISPAFARLQTARIAAARNLPVSRVNDILDHAIENPDLGFIGEPRINVLRLNLALDDLQS